MPRQFRKQKPYIVVFCEGESEQVYTDFLRDKFKDVAVIRRPKATGFLKKHRIVSIRIRSFETMRK